MFRSIATAVIALTLVGCSGDGDSTSGVEEVLETTKETTTTPPVEKKAKEKAPDPVVEEEPEIALITGEAVPLPAEVPVAVVPNRVMVEASLDDYCWVALGSRDESNAYTRLKVFYRQDNLASFAIEQGNTVELTIGHSYGDPSRTLYPVKPQAIWFNDIWLTVEQVLTPSSQPYAGSTDPYAGATYTFTPESEGILHVVCYEDTSAQPL